jgi:penicillin-binding protein 2
MSRYSDETQNFEARLATVQVLAFALFLLLGVRFWVLQVVHHDVYDEQARNNRLREIPIPAARGNILDRHGRILVDSRYAFDIKINREDVTKQNVEALIAVLHDNLGVNADWARSQINDTSTPRSRPITIKANIGEPDRAWVEAHEYEYPYLHVEPQPQRVYPHGTLLSHVLGYSGQISQEQLRAELPEFSGARAGDIVGQAGIERSHNQILMGREGFRRVVVDSSGRTVEEIERVEPVPGQDLYTTIDLDLQRVAEERLAATGLNGTAMALDPRTGEVLLLVSHPAFDPNLFSGGITPANYAALRDNPDRPLRDRAIQDIYPPGSTWKVIMAMAGLSEGIVGPDDHLICGGGISVGNRFAACHGSHGSSDVERAIAISCNGYFYRLGLKLGVDKIHAWATAMGLGRRTGIDLPNETAGYVPAADIKQRFRTKEQPPDSPALRWHDGDTINASIGQGYDRPTPVQMLHAIAGIATNGHFTTPHILLRAKASAIRSEISFVDSNVVDMPLDPSAYFHVMEGMRQVVTSGTARRAEVPGFDVCGKTGTAQVVSKRTGATGREREHAWFVGFAPKPAPGRTPEIAVVVLVENGGHGGQTSAPIAQAIIAEYVHRYHAGVAPTDGPAPDASPDLDPDTVELVPDDGARADEQPDTTGPAPAPTIVPEATPAGPGVADTPETPAAARNPLQGLMRERPPPGGPP